MNFYECFSCNEKDKKFEDASDYLKGIVEQLYKDNDLNLELLEYNIENLCHLLNVDVPSNDITVERKLSNNCILTNWIQYNNNYLKSCVNAQ